MLLVWIAYLCSGVADGAMNGMCSFNGGRSLNFMCKYGACGHMNMLYLRFLLLCIIRTIKLNFSTFH